VFFLIRGGQEVIASPNGLADGLTSSKLIDDVGSGLEQP
jgi:hypothetical protein